MLLSVASFNVNALRGGLKRKAIFLFSKQKQYDIILLQETNSTFTEEKLWMCEWVGQFFSAHGDNNGRGVKPTVFLKNWFKPVIGKNTI